MCFRLTCVCTAINKKTPHISNLIYGNSFWVLNSFHSFRLVFWWKLKVLFVTTLKCWPFSLDMCKGFLACMLDIFNTHTHNLVQKNRIHARGRVSKANIFLEKVQNSNCFSTKSKKIWAKTYARSFLRALSAFSLWMCSIRMRLFLNTLPLALR